MISRKRGLSPGPKGAKLSTNTRGETRASAGLFGGLLAQEAVGQLAPVMLAGIPVPVDATAELATMVMASVRTTLPTRSIRGLADDTKLLAGGPARRTSGLGAGLASLSWATERGETEGVKSRESSSG